MTPRDGKFVKRWATIRARGRLRYILVSGVISWGVPMFFVMTFVVSRPPHLTAEVLTTLGGVWAAGGFGFGASTWFVLERRYNGLVSRNEGRVSDGVA